MTNDLTTLDGSLDEMKDQLISELGDKGVTATFDSSTGLLGLIAKISDIQTGGGTGCSNLVMGDFTTGSTGASTGTVNLNYNGSGYPIALLVYVYGGAYNNSSSGNTEWYNSTNRYDCGLFTMVKARTNTAPTYASSGEDNYGIVSLSYKSSTSNPTSYARINSNNASSYVDSNTNAVALQNCVRFKGNGKTLSYYVSNRTSGTIGLARNTTFQYIVIYSQ